MFLTVRSEPMSAAFSASSPRRALPPWLRLGVMTLMRGSHPCSSESLLLTRRPPTGSFSSFRLQM